MNPPLSEQDAILLNASLDEEITPAERLALEKRLAADPALRAELEALRGVKAAIQLLPRLRVPRNFTLDAAAYSRPIKKAWWEFGGLAPTLTAVGVIAVALVCGGLVLLQSPSMPAAAPLSARQAEEPALSVAVTEQAFSAPAAAVAPESGVVVQPAGPLPALGTNNTQPQTGGLGGGSNDSASAPSASGAAISVTSVGGEQAGLHAAAMTAAPAPTVAMLAPPAPTGTPDQNLQNRTAPETPTDKMAVTAAPSESTGSAPSIEFSPGILLIAAGVGLVLMAGLTLAVIGLRRRR